MNLLSNETGSLSVTLDMGRGIEGAHEMRGEIHMAFADEGGFSQLLERLVASQDTKTLLQPTTLTGMARPRVAMLEAETQVLAVCKTGWPDCARINRALTELEERLVEDLNESLATKTFRVTRILISRPALRAKAVMGSVVF